MRTKKKHSNEYVINEHRNIPFFNKQFNLLINKHKLNIIGTILWAR